MSSSAEVLSQPEVWTALNEATWQSWAARGRAHDRHSDAVRSQLVRWIPMAALLMAAVLWPLTEQFAIVVRFIVAACAMAVMFQAFRERQYAVAPVFAALALLYNPVIPVFNFSGGGQRALVLASLAPFAASLAWRISRKKRNDK